ncbi:MAG: SDR family oxidoreductase, partial [Sphingopyxis sp.]
YTPQQMDRVAALMPLGRLPRPDDVADAILYLIGAGSVTGQTIFVDGGANLRSYERDFAFL